MSLASAIRHRFPPDAIVEHIERLLADAKDATVMLAVLRLAIEYGYGKPMTTAEITMRTPDAALNVNLSSMSVEQLALIAGVHIGAVDPDDDPSIQ